VIPANTLWFSLFVLVIVALVARWVRNHTTTHEEEENEQVRYLIRSSETPAGEHLGPQAELVVTRYYFRQTDIDAGPPDPADFYDELFIELASPGSEQNWQNSIHVATPRALDRVMVEEHWDSIIGTELLVVRRYELDKILQGAIDHLQEIYETRVKITGKGFISAGPMA
jgi:hypothetical protein